LVSQEKEKWPLGFTKIESPTTVIGGVSQETNMASGLYENGKPSSSQIGWVSQDKKHGLWALRK
jgi:hypothetical protein